MVAIPALGRLRNLHLDDMQSTIHLMPAALAQSLTSLTELRLFSSYVPPEISYMTALQILHVKGKDSIKLGRTIVDIVAALPNLQILRLQDQKEIGAANKETVNALISLSQRFPSLKLIVQ